jgi:hypothetical protein
MQILVDNWTGYGTAIPSMGNDAGGREYLAWSVGDKAAFNIRLPENYISGTDLVLTFEESTPGVSLNHKWSVDVSRALDTAETVVSEVSSSAVANTNTEAAITLTSSGKLNSVDLAVGDLISCVVSRVSASASEDTNDIKIYATVISLDASDYAESGCSGRVGAIIDQVRNDFNDVQARRISNTEIIRWCNRAIDEMAQADLFMKETALDVTEDSGEIDLLATVSDFVDAFTLRWHEDTDFMVPLENWQDFKTYSLQMYPYTETPFIWLVVSNTLHFHPAPSSDQASGLYMFHSYRPANLECLSNYTPNFPASYDPLLVFYCLHRAHSKFFPDHTSPEKAQEWFSLWQDGFSRLKRQVHPPVLSMVPYR